MTAEDMNLLRRHTRDIRNGTTSAFQGSPTCSALLCLPPEENPHDRFVAFLSNYVLLTGLILSATIGVALNPIKVESLPEEQQNLANAYNLMAAVLVFMNLVQCTVLTWFLNMTLGMSSHEIIRVLTHSRGFVVFEWISNLNMYVILALMLTATHLNSPPIIAWIITGTVSGLSIFCFVSVGTLFQKMFPVGGTAWLSCFGLSSTKNKIVAKRIGNFMLGIAEAHLGRDTVELDELIPTLPHTQHRVQPGETNPAPGPPVITNSALQNSARLEGSEGRHPTYTPIGAAIAGKAAAEREGEPHKEDAESMQVDVEEEEGALRDFIAHALKGRMVSADRINLLVAALLEEDLTLDVLREAAAEGGQHLVSAYILYVIHIYIYTYIYM